MSARETLYSQLPSVYRRRDAEQGEPLRALLAIIEEQLDAVQADIETTWDNWFVETAEEWLVPYLGQALGLPVTRNVEAVAFSRRAFVANAIRYRRGKGTAAMLELLARDVTNYPARVVEFFTRLAWNEAINHQTGRAATLDIRSTVALERLGGPFENVMRAVEVRRIASGRGTHNLPNLGLFLWRTQLWPLIGINAEDMGIAGRSAWRFRPVGGDRPLYAPLETETDPAAVATEASVPLALSRRRLWEQARRLGSAMTWPFSIEVHGDDGIGRVVRSVAATQIDVCNLDVLPASPGASRVVVDPQRGVMLLGTGLTAGLTGVEVVTDHFIATPGDVGAGPWNRDRAAQAWLAGWTGAPESRQVGFQVMILRDTTATGIVPTMDEAVRRWNDFLTGLPDDTARSRALGLILIGDSRTHAAPPARVVRMPTGAVLGILAATWPLSPDPAGGPALVRLPGRLVADSVRPLVRGNLRVQGQARPVPNRGELLVDGVVLDGRIRVQNGALQGLRLQSTTVLAASGLDIETASGANAGLRIALRLSIVTDIVAAGALDLIEVFDSVVTGDIDTPQAAVDFSASTVLGTVAAVRLDATDTIFDDRVTIEERQEGCVRFSYVPADSGTPRRFRCQPDLAQEEAGADAEAAGRALLRVRPTFVTRDPHEPGFLLLDPRAAAEIRGAAEDGGEPGCWNHLQHGIRLANLRNAMPQFLRFGLEPGIFFLA